MKVAIVCDQLVERTPTHALTELVANLFPDSTIFTIAHKKGKVLGPLEMHPIRSTFLSNEVDSIEELRSKSFLIPKAIKNLSIPCSFDAVICISSGLAQCFSSCKKSKKLTINVENIYKEKSLGLLTKFFSSSLNRMSDKGIDFSRDLFCHHPLGEGSKELTPFVNTNDWHPIEQNKKVKKSVIVHPNGFTKKDLLLMKEMTKQKGLDFVLTFLPKDISSDEFFHLEHPCSGELLPQFHQALCYVSGTKHSYPFSAIEAILSGVPVISIFSDFNSRVLLSESTRFIQKIDQFESALEDVKFMNISAEHDQLMRKRYSEKIFKAKFLKQLKQHEIDFSIG